MVEFKADESSDHESCRTAWKNANLDLGAGRSSRSGLPDARQPSFSSSNYSQEPHYLDRCSELSPILWFCCQSRHRGGDYQ